MGRYSDNYIGNYLIQNARFIPDKPAIIYGDRHVNWREMNDRINRLAQAFLSMGVKKGDKIAFMFHNCPEFLEINWATQKVGAVPVPMNYRFMTNEIVFQCQNCDAAIFLFEDIWIDQIEAALPELPDVKAFICRGKNRPEGIREYEDVMADHPPVEPNVPTTGDDICVIIYTGGTTGYPKGVLLSYQNHMDMYINYLTVMALSVFQLDFSDEQTKKLVGYAEEWHQTLALKLLTSSVSRRAGNWVSRKNIFERVLRATLTHTLGSPDRLKRWFYFPVNVMIPSFPFFHSGSYQSVLLSAILGNHVYCLTGGTSFDSAKIFNMIERIRPTVLMNVPTGWKKLVDAPEAANADVSSLFVGFSGAGVCPVSLKKKIMKTFPGMLLMDVLGQTEMTPVTSIRIDTSPETLKDRSVGRSLVETRIVDENGNDKPQGETGEIVYRSTTVMKGYYKEEEKTKETFIDGWFKSGDLGYMDAEGELRIVERIKECINTGGEKVFPGEIEEIIETHPQVDKVCAIGVPDETWGHAVRAVVQLKEGESVAADDIIAYCEGKMAGYKRPRTVVFVDEFPISPVGKVLRAKIREQYGQAAQ